jgi:alpha-tubulin suppressor-like RCC1 family protein
LTDWNKIAAGGSHSLAIKSDGTLWAWGQATVGQVGDGQIAANRSSPVQIGALNSWSNIYVGRSHSIAIKGDHTMWTWGLATSGQLGDGQIAANQSSPVQIGSGDWNNSAISSGCSGNHTVFIK